MKYIRILTILFGVGKLYVPVVRTLIILHKIFGPGAVGFGHAAAGLENLSEAEDTKALWSMVLQLTLQFGVHCLKYDMIEFRILFF